MSDSFIRRSKLLALIDQKNWHVEAFIQLLKESSNRRKELVFYGRLAQKLSAALSLMAIFKLEDPRASLLNFVVSYPTFNSVEKAYYLQIFKPVLDYMIESQPNCIHFVGSDYKVKNWLIQALLSRFNVEPYFVDFMRNFQSAMESRL